MKNLYSFLLIFIFSASCVAKEAQKLAEIPWKAIVEMNRQSRFIGWTQDIQIKLFGNYSVADSLMIENSIYKLNGITETVKISFSKHDRSNLEIYFLDSLNYMYYDQIIKLPKNHKSQFSYMTLQSNTILFSLALNMNLVPPQSKQNFLTNTLAFTLFPVFWDDRNYFKAKNRNEIIHESIFRATSIEDRDKLYYEEMQDFDIQLLTAIYSPDYKDKLALADKQFKPLLTIPEWAKVNPHSYLLLPFGILLLLFFPAFIKISKKIKHQISNNILQFNIIGLIGLLIIAVIGSLYFTLANILKYYTLSFYEFNKNLVAGIFIILIIGLPAINLLRLAEILIHKNTHRKLLKIVLIFLSTGLIPFVSFLGIYIYFSIRDIPHKLQNTDYKLLSYVFVSCMVLAGFRALISYFILKEKDLIIENETKLSRLRELKTKAELNVLHSRINPHFLYNSLNSIAGLAHDNADQTEHMALSLSKLFRYSINKEKSDWTTFKEELEMVKIYLDVEKVRFDDRLTYSVEISKELEEQLMPRFIIQPLVENAVKHGISNFVEGGKIKVSIKREGKQIIISVADSGQPFPADLIPGFGIQSIYDKLEILYKDKFEMNFSNNPLKQVTLKLM